MRRHSNQNSFSRSLDIFRPFTDLMSNAFMIISFFLVLSLFQALALNKRLETATPIIIDKKSGTFNFRSGSAELKPELVQYIESKVVPQIKTIIQQRSIAFIQVIGHTDGVAINQGSNLDQKLQKVAQEGDVPAAKELRAGSNADLGLMRAIAVVQELQKNTSLKGLKFRAYSAAQLYLPDGKKAPVLDEDRRRIEIRFVPPGKEE